MSAPIHRLLMTADCVGGVWDYALELSQALEPAGVEVTLVVMGGQLDPEQVRQAACIPNVHLIGRDLKLEWMTDPAEDLERANHLLRELEAQIRPDVVHINGFAQAAAGFVSPVLAVGHSCVASWWAACRSGPMSHEWDDYRRRVRRGLDAADCFVAPSQAILNAFVASHGPIRRSRVILNGRDGSRYRPCAKRRFALSAGRLWDEAKNMQGLCEAARRVDGPILIAGDGALPAGSPANVVALGRVPPDALAHRLSEAAVFAAPIRYEPFGLAVLEAALSGCALVLGDIPTQRELWEGVATFVPPDDPEAIAAAINALLADPERAEEKGEQARQHGLRYDTAAMASGYLDLYGELAARVKADAA